jgi:hypothetical protein
MWAWILRTTNANFRIDCGLHDDVVALSAVSRHLLFRLHLDEPRIHTLIVPPSLALSSGLFLILNLSQQFFSLSFLSSLSFSLVCKSFISLSHH